MKEKIKKILFMKSKNFFIIFLLLSLSLFGCLVYFLPAQIVREKVIEISYWKGWNWNGWEAISTIALISTIIVIAIQAHATKKFTKFSVMPSVSFVLRSRKTIYNRSSNTLDLELPESMEMKEKLKTQFIIRNNSKFPIFFKVKITFEINGKRRPPFKDYWENPLPADSEIIRYPEVVHLENFIKEIDNIKGKKIIAHIKYAYAPKFAPEVSSKTIRETWTFDLEKYEWVGPAGIRDIMIFLPGEDGR